MRAVCASFSAAIKVAPPSAAARTRRPIAARMVRRIVVDAMRRVEPKPVEMVLVDPVAGVGDKELAYRTGGGPVEIERLTPLGRVLLAEIAGRGRAQIVSVGPELIVDDVEDDREAERVGSADQAAQLVGPSVEAGRREQIDPVITPAEPAGKFGDRHHLYAGDAKLCQT